VTIATTSVWLFYISPITTPCPIWRIQDGASRACPPKMAPGHSSHPRNLFSYHSRRCSLRHLVGAIRRRFFLFSLLFFQLMVNKAWGFAIFTSLATIVVILYTVLTSSVNALKAAYNYWAVLGLEIFMVVFWLASMAALAALRATFTIPVEIDGCFNDGTGGVCFKKRQLMKRAVATKGYLNMIAGSAALSAIIMLVSILSNQSNALTIFQAPLHMHPHRFLYPPPPLSLLESTKYCSTHERQARGIPNESCGI